MSQLQRYVAAVPYRVRGGRVEILLVTSRGKRDWIVPKGRVRSGEPPTEAARREAAEEAGLLGYVTPTPMGTCGAGGRKAPPIEVYRMEVVEVLDRWPEADLRERRWWSAREAVICVREEFRPFVAALANLVAAHGDRPPVRRRQPRRRPFTTATHGGLPAVTRGR